MTHPLSGPRAKVEVAKQHVDALQIESQLFFNRYIGGALVGRRDAKTGWYPLQPRQAVTLPDGWAVAIGEIAHDLRSALDGLICQLAILRDAKRDHLFCRERKTGFPIYIYGPRSRKRPRFDRKRLNYLEPGHVTRIDGFQPYRRGNLKRHNPLWLLHEINDTDKHNLTVLIDRWTLDRETQRQHEFAAFPIPGRRALVETTRKARAGQVDMEKEPACQVAFGNWCEAVEGFPVVRTLRHIADSVDHIVESFSGDFT